MAPPVGYLLYWLASWIAVIVITAGIIVWLYFARPDKDPLGLAIAGTGIIIWVAARAVRYWLAGR